ncbi:WG repeat-containing protein [Pseudochryseolinea flava]|uniref:WG repeat-containing protein n=1 Tax=Pseudochryseolinea flava TaxID=2059302 RepID=A0A364Y2Z0_9BACT|nr:WG repeat-containing protein [Pseudochryseolinea flava]RAW00682.1 hypothetical protein DQQ10_13925 [Pseudochryseolinea flava]
MMSEKSALKNIRASRFEKANKQVRKLLDRDSTNAVTHYLVAIYFFSPANAGYNIDSAYRYTMTSWKYFSGATSKNQERMRRFPIDSVVLVTLRQRIDSAAFERAKRANTSAAYNTFLVKFPLAISKNEAVELRNEAAFKEASQENTREAFRYYLDQYPQSQKAMVAQARYEKLVFDDETKSQRAEDFQQFVMHYPNSPHRDEAIQKIFEIQTASGERDDYLAFIALFRDHLLSKKAKAIVNHLDINDADSLHTGESMLVPILHNGKFGFMNALGEEVIQPLYEEIDKRYRCGNITDKILALDGKAVSHEGVVASNQSIDVVEPVGNGFWLAGNDDCFKVIHHSGFVVGDSCVEDAKVIAGKYLALKSNGYWGLWAMNGRRMIGQSFDNITNVGEIVVFEKDKKYRLATTQTIARSANQQPLKLSDAFDACTPWRQQRVWLKAGRFEGVMDQNLQVVIGFEEGKLEQTYFGASRKTDHVQLYDERGDKTHAIDAVHMIQPWALVKKSQQWHIFDTKDHTILPPAYDTIQVKGPFAIAIRHDSTTIIINKARQVKLNSTEAFTFIPGQDSSAFFVIATPKTKTLFNERGKKEFVFTGDKIQHAGGQYFIITKNDKKGLLGAGGKALTPIAFDAIGTVRDGTISLLKGTRFGTYLIKTQKMINPEYAKNITQYNKKFLTAYKSGAWGFVDMNNKPISKFEFDEIQYWNDSLAFVRKQTQWSMIQVAAQQTRLHGIKSIKYIRNTATEKLAIIDHEKKYGVLSSTQGVIIPLNFSDVINVGSADVPVFFTEKHVEEASVFVVIYYDANGKFIRKEVYEADDYEKIYCGN